MNVTYLRGALLAAIACTLVGASFTANSVLGDYPYAGGQALRYGLAGLLLLPLLRRGGAPPPAATLRTLSGRQWARLALLAAVGMVGFNLAVLAAERSAEPAVPGVFVGCAPILVSVLVPLLDGRRPARAVLYASALVAAGAFTVQGWGRTDTAGIVCSVGALAGEVGFAVIAVPVLRPLGPRLLSATVCVIAAAESAALGLVLDGGGLLRVPSPGETVALLWQAAVVTVVGFVCWYMGMQRIGAERATLFSGLIPVSAALTAPLVGTGSYGVAQAAGSCLVGLGVALGSGVLHRRRSGTDSAGGAEKHPRDESRAVVRRDLAAARQPDQPGAGEGVLDPDAPAVRKQPVAAAPRDGHRQPRHIVGEQDIASGGQRLVEPGRLAQSDRLQDHGLR